MLDNIGNMYEPIILIACLIVGYCLKRFNKFINDYIPITLAVLGAVLSVVLSIEGNNHITLEIVVYGALSGLASTGFHQAFKNIIEGNYQADEENE